MIIAKADAEHTDWEYTDAQRNRLFSMLSNTVYSHSKRKHFEYLIMGELSYEEYQNFKLQFLRDKIDSINMKGAGSATEIKTRLGKFKNESH